MTINAPFNEFSTSIQPDWIDDNGHMNVAFYHLVFDLAARPFFNWLGFTEENRKAHNISTFALETHLSYLSEVKVDAGVRVESRLVDMQRRKSTTMPDVISKRLEEIKTAHSHLPRTWQMGHVMAVDSKPAKTPT